MSTEHDGQVQAKGTPTKRELRPLTILERIDQELAAMARNSPMFALVDARREIVRLSAALARQSSPVAAEGELEGEIERQREANTKLADVVKMVVDYGGRVGLPGLSQIVVAAAAALATGQQTQK